MGKEEKKEKEKKDKGKIKMMIAYIAYNAA